MSEMVHIGFGDNTIVRESEQVLRELRRFCCGRRISRVFSNWGQLSDVWEMMEKLGFTLSYASAYGNGAYRVESWFGEAGDACAVQELVEDICRLFDIADEELGDAREDVSHAAHLAAELLGMYRSGTSWVSYATSNKQCWSDVGALAQKVASRNASYPEHPIDSLLAVLADSSASYSANVEDEALSRFIKCALVTSLIQIGELMESGCTYQEALEAMYGNGFLAWFSAYGRHAASEDYRDVIETLKIKGLWLDASSS